MRFLQLPHFKALLNRVPGTPGVMACPRAGNRPNSGTAAHKTASRAGNTENSGTGRKGRKGRIELIVNNLIQTRSGVVTAIISTVLGDVVIRKGGICRGISGSTGDLLVLSVFLTLKPSLERLGVIGLEFDLD